MDEVLVFDVSGDFVHFRKFYTTTSPLTFSVPPRTVLIGLLGAIIGLKREEYLKYLSNKKCKIAVRVLTELKKIVIPENYREIGPKLKKQPAKIAPTPVEFVKDVKYRLYVNLEDKEIYEKLKENLMNHKSVFTPYLGTSESLCNFRFVSEMAIQKKENLSDNKIELNCVCPTDMLKNIDFTQKNHAYLKATMPYDMAEGRVVNEYKEAIFEKNGNAVLATPNGYYELENGEKILFL